MASYASEYNVFTRSQLGCAAKVGAASALQIQRMMAAKACARLFRQQVDQGRIVASEKCHTRENALLQIAIGKKILAECVRMAAQAWLAL